MATLRVPSSVPTFANDCDELRKALVAPVTNEAMIINILAHRNEIHREMIRSCYPVLYRKKYFMEELKDHLAGDFLRVTQLWMMGAVNRDLVIVHESTKALTCNNYWAIIEVACTRSSEHLLSVRQAYRSIYKRSLEEDVSQNTKGDMRKLLVPLVSSYRYEGKMVNLNLAISEAKILYDIIISQRAYNDEEIIRIFTTRSKAQINETLKQFTDLYENSINNVYGDSICKVDGISINKCLKGDNEYLKLLRATIKCLTFPEKYFEKALRLGVKKLGNDDQALTRVVTTRAEVDMERIKEEYLKRNNISLDNAIVAEGAYERFLLALIGHEDY